ncbi:hypothetical protein SAMN05216215_104746 [Saccharopolyspora shandongensis]|uniref:Uncharacterized protein n=1 Tax=Saccharopolyspora shandongensis TaxID=418495 RepID=A0A1H3QFQ7_9PSEU|nr:hypothetical protein [Saccharopolyspora shandongensis]SDZ12130.1 hypothetical protein SAMN05216215_104746 [Saccharopolyspora shandongensis]
MNEETPFADLPLYWQGEIRKLRAECAKLRNERKVIRAAVEMLTNVTTGGDSK